MSEASAPSEYRFRRGFTDMSEAAMAADILTRYKLDYEIVQEEGVWNLYMKETDDRNPVD